MRQYYWLSSSWLSSSSHLSAGSPLSADLFDAPCIEPSTDASVDLENLRRQHQLILNAIGEGVYGVDLQGNATFINPAGAQMIGWEIHELIGKSMHDVLHHSRLDHTPYPKHTCPIYAAFKDGVVHRVTDEVFWRKDGTSFPVEYISTPMHDEQGKLIGAVVTFQDITQRKWAEAVLHRANEELELKVRERTTELYQANEQLKELSELRSRVVSMVCHEFRNPLNNILLSVSSLGRYDTHLSAEQKENYLLGIKENVERMTQMIDAILMIGKVEARQIEIQPSQVELVQFCRNLVSEINYSNSNQIEFICRNKAIHAALDEKLLRSILTNILSNSVQYSLPHSSIQFRLLRQKQQVIFQIKDQGIGIPPEDLPYLFEPFHRARNVSNIPGTGLGLNIVKRFVDLQQGKIEVESKLGAGTTFTVTLASE
jgi:PAS domain S-box-containing protein